ncbi:MAG: hypothetical protein CMO80_08195 [Verrucomicrobiales bacterium]|nr:hypothetical protein [Verrucomicrobiales bacterium]|tara:strand:+ start:2390 stop:3043 length:654 start_codon:yes stop_codon:yes gene_type:complete
MNEEELSNSNETEEPVAEVVIDDAKFGWSTLLIMGPTILLMVFVYIGMETVRVSAGGFSRDVYVRNLRGTPPAIGLPEDIATIIRGRMIYKSKCAACHQPHGMGDGVFPPVKGSDWVLAEGPNRMIRLVLDGIRGPIEVSGKTFDNNMVPWRPQLSDKEIADVLSFLRNADEWGHKTTLVRPEEVAKIRAETEEHAGTQWTADQLLQVPAADAEEEK